MTPDDHDPGPASGDEKVQRGILKVRKARTYASTPEVLGALDDGIQLIEGGLQDMEASV